MTGLYYANGREDRFGTAIAFPCDLVHDMLQFLWLLNGG